MCIRDSPDIEQAVPFAVASILDSPEQRRVAAGTHFGVAEFALARAFDAASQLRSHQVHAVADAENRDAEFEDHLRGLEIVDVIDRIGAAGEDDSLRRKVADERLGDVVGMQLAVDLLLSLIHI